MRIAVLGDSFIEGDILTADLRERLQQAYGGGGAGFAPMASPLTAFRRTIKTQSKGWTSYNIMPVSYTHLPPARCRRVTPLDAHETSYLADSASTLSFSSTVSFMAASYRFFP